jgi:alginate O-acetyltransferase complex protein AlgJ
MEAIAHSSTIASEGPGPEALPPDAGPRAEVRRATDLILVSLFLVAIFAPLVGVKIGRHGWDVAQRAENRRMVAEPSLLRTRELHIATTKGKLKALAKFPGEFKYYFSDHFGFRSLLIRTHGLMMVEGLGVTSNPSVILGKDGWLYLAGDKSLEDWRNIDPFTPAELESWRQMLESRSRFCADRGIPYLVVFAPSKYDIYPEYMPEELTQVRRESRLDQLLAYLAEGRSPVQVLDLRDALLSAKGSGIRLFQKTDTHWNDLGGWLAYHSMMSAVADKLPTARVLQIEEFDAVTTIRPGMDLAGLLGLNDVLSEESFDLRPKVPLRLPHVEQNMVEPIVVNADAKGGPSVIMFRDSFMTNVLPWIVESFGRGVYLWEDGFDQKLIEAEHPDIVIQEFAQRKLMQPIDVMNKTQTIDRAALHGSR